MKVFTKWPALVPAIRRAGHEPVLVDSETEYELTEGERRALDTCQRCGKPYVSPADHVECFRGKTN